MNNFEPIAIIGTGCVFPGCFDYEGLWEIVKHNKVEITDPDMAYWRVDMNDIIAAAGDATAVNKAWTSKGGYIHDFDSRFNSSSFALDKEIVDGLDPVFKWSFFAAQSALKNAGYAKKSVPEKTGLIMGNLSYPSRSFSQYYEERILTRLFPEWKNPEEPVAPVNRFMSGLPAILTAKALGLQGESFAIDAACASSLYALKLACDKLQNNTGDMMLVGGVCAADQLFLHTGFTALNAMSRSGQSRPFHKDADGLIPAEGSGFIVIKRLRDAIAGNDNILAVVRGVGLSNDGRSGGFLLPSREGQVKCIRQALESADIAPETIGYIECHATGTSTGDAVEIKSLREVYGDNPLHLSSLKGNIGHTITSSGIAGIIKVIGSFLNKTLPPTANAYPLANELAETPFTVTDSSVKWESTDNRRAGISNFGFGGNNAHVILEEWNPDTSYLSNHEKSPKATVAIVGVEIQTESIPDAKAYIGCISGSEGLEPAKDAAIGFDMRKLSSPPNDLKHTLSQQLLMLNTVQNVLRSGVKLDKENTGVFVGMGADAEVNRYAFRRRLPELLNKGGVTNAEVDIAGLELEIAPFLNSAAALGTMPNMSANRINNQYDINGIGFTVSCEELSGTKALKVAINNIECGALTAAIVGAVDISNEPVNKEALSDVLDISAQTSDSSVVLILKNHEQALKDGDHILAIFGDAAKSDDYNLPEAYIMSKTGYSHAASGLLKLGAAVLLTKNRICANETGTGFRPILESADGFSYSVVAESLFGGSDTFVLHSKPVASVSERATGQILLHCYAADTLSGLKKAVEQNSKGMHGQHRLCIISSETDAIKLREDASAALSSAGLREGWMSENVHYRSKPVPGEIAFVYTGAAAAYSGMGKELLEEFPRLTAGLKPYCNEPSVAAEWAYGNDSAKAGLPFYQLAGSSFLCQVHSCFTTKVLQIRPQAAIGLSSGETNAVIALGLWDDMDALMKEIYESDLYDVALGGSFQSVKEYWGLDDNEKVAWENWRILAPVEEVKKIVATEDRVYLTIINTENDCVIGGDSVACARIIAVFGSVKAIPLHHDIAVHCAAVKPFERTWRALHTRNVNPVPGVRFYSNYLDGVYGPTTESVADALTGQALHAIDFPKIIKKAWNDGVRIFVEHGPRNSLSSAIRHILKGEEFLCVAMDRFGQSGALEALKVAGELWCSGVAVNTQTLISHTTPQEDNRLEIKFPMHMPDLFEYLPLRRKMKNIDTEKNGLIHSFTPAPKLAVTRRRTQKNMPSAADHTPVEPIVPLVKIHESPVAYLAEQGNVAGHDEHVLGLISYQHNSLVEAHQHFLKTLLSAQEQYIAFTQNSMLQLANDAVAEHIDLIEIERRPEIDVVRNDVFSIPEQEQERTSAEHKQPRQAAPSERIPETKTEHALPGPKISREELITLSSGKISSVLGPLFEQQDHFAIQVRMPEPPLLLCDRVAGIKGEAGSLGLGTIWTETDVKQDSWYLHNGRMPPGIFIEAGQADLLLISWLGIDFQNKGERSYRLLGCELKFYGVLPKPGETLKYEIHVDGYAKSGETTLFFFHYDCKINGELRISVRNGQAGFFTVQELEESKGVIWDPLSAGYAAECAAMPELHTHKTSFGEKEIEAYTLGDMVTCFGEELEWTKTHTRSPRSQAGYQNFIKSITQFDLTGGPAGRGYLRSETTVRPDDWYFKGHFNNDPCMPGTLMADACLQMMAFFMVGAGLSVNKDGWRFEPVTNETYKFVCRGQVTPTSKKVTYEIFVDQITDDGYPTMYAHVLTTVDGNKAFLCERLGLRLVPDYPLQTMEYLIEKDVPGKVIASYKGFKFGHRSLMNCALGNPEDAFGPDFIKYTNNIRSPRLPGPPYHFMTRIAEFDIRPGQYKNNPFVVADYDIPEDAWYLCNPGAVMPYAVLMEVALQPCGWFSTFICQPDIEGKDLLFRNLDGKAIQHRAVTSADRTITTKTTLTSVSVMGDVIIVKFDVVSSIEDQPVFTMNTVFGFFDTASMRLQKGLPISADEQKNINLDHNAHTDLTVFPDKYFGNKTACLPSSKILMIDRISSYYPQGGKYGKGYMKAEKTVVKGDWFFKAHFFQDPVQPGSLGVEAMLQLIQFYLIDQGHAARFDTPYFEPVLLKDETEWHYRGQVTPDKKLISIDFDVKNIHVETNEVVLVVEARLWADGLKIYYAPNIGMRMFEGKTKI